MDDKNLDQFFKEKLDAYQDTGRSEAGWAAVSGRVAALKGTGGWLGKSIMPYAIMLLLGLNILWLLLFWNQNQKLNSLIKGKLETPITTITDTIFRIDTIFHKDTFFVYVPDHSSSASTIATSISSASTISHPSPTTSSDLTIPTHSPPQPVGLLPRFMGTPDALQAASLTPENPNFWVTRKNLPFDPARKKTKTAFCAFKNSRWIIDRHSPNRVRCTRI